MFFFYNYTIIISDPKRTPCLVQIVICLEIIMKKILTVFLALVIFVPCGWSSPAPVGMDTKVELTVDTFKVIQQKNGHDKVFFFSKILYPQKIRTVEVDVFVFESNVPPSRPRKEFLSKNPAAQAAADAVYDYLPQAWEAWRTAANKYLSKKYQLPKLTFKRYDGAERMKGGHLFPLTQTNQVVGLTLELYVTEVMTYNDKDGVKGLGIGSFPAQGAGYGRLGFQMRDGWHAWLDSKNKTEEERKKAKNDYERGILEDLASRMFGNIDDAREKEPKLAKELEQNPVEQWHKKGPWAKYNQTVFIHEFGHLFGLAHEDDATSIMYHSMNGAASPTAPNNADALRLATLACYYHNQRAKSQVCVPSQEETAEARHAAAQEKAKKQIVQSKWKTGDLIAGGKLLNSSVDLDEKPELKIQDKEGLLAKGSAQPRKGKVSSAKSATGHTPAKRNQATASNPSAPVISGTRPTGTFNKANPKPIMPVTHPQPVISRKSTPKERLDFFIATHHGLKDSLEAVRRGTALPEQQRELQAYNALFEEFKKSRTSAAHKGTPIAAKPSAPKPSAPKAQPVAPKAAPKAAPVAPRPSAPKAAPKAKPAASKATCVVCHQEMDEGTFYTDSVGRTVHKHSSCAYHFFKRFHKTDDASLDRYSGFYFFNTPNDVVGAKADMKKLDLTVSDIRRYRGAQEASAEAYRLSLGADKAAKARTKAKAEKCRVFQPVTPADVAFFERQNQSALVRITQKQKAKRRLSKKETSLKRQYQQLKKNMELTKECKN